MQYDSPDWCEIARRAADPSRHNFYIAAVPPWQVAEALFNAMVVMGTGYPFRWLKLHMSILSLNTLPGGEHRHVEHAWQAVTGLRLPEFDIVLDRFETFGGGSAQRHALVFTSSEINKQPDMIARKLGNKIALSCRRPFEPRKFAGSRCNSPHVTACYGAAFAGSRELLTPIRWEVHELHLIDNWIGIERYDRVARLPLLSRELCSPENGMVVIDHPRQLTLQGVLHDRRPEA